MIEIWEWCEWGHELQGLKILFKKKRKVNRESYRQWDRRPLAVTSYTSWSKYVRAYTHPKNQRVDEGANRGLEWKTWRIAAEARPYAPHVTCVTRRANCYEGQEEVRICAEPCSMSARISMWLHTWGAASDLRCVKCCHPLVKNVEE